MDIVIEGPLVLSQRWKHSILWMRVGIRTLWLLFDAGPREIRPRRWLAQSSVIYQGSILMLFLRRLSSVLTDVVLHVAFDYAVLESLCVNHGAVLHQLKVVTRHYDLCGRQLLKLILILWWAVLSSHENHLHELVHVAWRGAQQQGLRRLILGQGLYATLGPWIVKVCQRMVHLLQRLLLLLRRGECLRHLFYLYNI